MFVCIRSFRRRITSQPAAVSIPVVPRYIYLQQVLALHAPSKLAVRFVETQYFVRIDFFIRRQFLMLKENKKQQRRMLFSHISATIKAFIIYDVMGNIVKSLSLSEEIWQKNNKMPREKDYSGMTFLRNCCQVRTRRIDTIVFAFKGANVYEKVAGIYFSLAFSDRPRI